MSGKKKSINADRGYALVSGSSGGLGLELARQLAAKGYGIIFNGRNIDKLKAEADKAAEDFGVKTFVVQSDLSKPGGPEKLFKEATAQAAIDVFVANAGIGVFGLSANLNPEAVERMLYLNMLSLTSLNNAFARYFQKKGGGYILNVGSLAAEIPEPYLASYAASKSYVLNFSVALNGELKGSGVSVTCIQPGFIRTGFDENAGIKSRKYKEYSAKNGLSAAKAARIGLKMMFRRKAAGAIGLGNKLSKFFVSILPRTVRAAFIKKGISGLISDHK